MAGRWYLEHVTTRDRIDLHQGENLMGRHSCCKITLGQIYDFVSREHVNIIVSNAGVVVQEMNSRNGVFINEQRMSGEFRRMPVVEGTIISLGVEGHYTDIPRNYPIFVLRQVAAEAMEIVLSSDDDDDTRPLAAQKTNDCNPVKEFNLGHITPDLEKKVNTTDQEGHPSCTNLHLPKIPEVKQELVCKATDEMRKIFGDADEAILGTAMDINPYLHNQLNKKSDGTASTSANIRDGDVMELDTDSDKMQPPPPPKPLESVDDEYDEHFAMSQAVLQEMKAEMAFSDGEEDFSSFENRKEEERLDSPSSQISYDEITIDESDDDELYDKVADWSNKLLSQKVPDAIKMSQAYPLLEDSDSDQENGSPFKMKVLTKSLRIDSSSEDESSHPVLANGEYIKLKMNILVILLLLSTADSTTADPSPSCCVRIQSPTDDNLENRDQQEQQDQNGSKSKRTKWSSSSSHIRSMTIQFREGDKVKADEPQKNGKKQDQTLNQNPSPRLLNRSRSCYMERPIEVDEPLGSKQVNEDMKEKQREPRSGKHHKSMGKECHASKEKQNAPPKKTEEITSNKTIHAREHVDLDNTKSVTPRKENTVENVIPLKKGSSPRLLNRSKSCFIDLTDNIAKTKEDSPGHGDTTTRAELAKDTRFVRGPSIIEAPFMSKNRCKVPSSKDKQKIIDRQRFVDYQNEINAKWYQKPKDKKREDKVIKENRREALKKLSDKPKDEENIPSTSSSNKRKNCTSVPTVSNTNRGEFLTKGIDSGPPTKIAKKVEKPQLPILPVKNSIPKRRSTTETSLQQLPTADDLAKFPEPHCSRPPERKEAQQARNRRTCNRVSFADLERANRTKKPQKRVRFCDKVNIIYINNVCGASKPVRKSKDSLKICLSTYSERREWTLKGNYMVNDILYHKRTILTWANQWLKHGSVDAVAATDVLMPIPSEFSGFKHYRKTFLPLMKLELLTTIERDYESSKTMLDLQVIAVYCEKEVYHLVARSNCCTYFIEKLCQYSVICLYFTAKAKPIGKFDLYTLSSGSELAETFASLLAQKTVGGNSWDMTFLVCAQVSIDKMKTLKQLVARPVVDSLRVELGALSAIHQLYRSPLCRRILMPTEAVKTVQIPALAQALAYKGFSKLNKDQEDICLRIYERVIDDINPSVTLVQGPPGTGKSILLSNLSLQCLYGRASVMLDRKILICAHSNTAVDHMVKALSKAHSSMRRNHFQLLRFGLNEKISEHSRKYSLEPHFKKAKNDKRKRLAPENIEMLKKQQCDLSAEIQKLKQNPNLMSTYLQNMLEKNQQQLLLINEQLNPPLSLREEYDITKMCLKRAHIVCTTLSSCVKLANYVDFFDICIIDEATQCTEPWTLLPMRFGIKHLVLVGDTQQLPAVVLSKKAIDFGLGNSMFDRIQKSLKHVNPGDKHLVHTKLFKLSMQYRMHPEICRWPNKYFYENQLVSADLTAKPSPLIPYCVVNLSYTRDTGGNNGNRSISNDEEARFVAQLLAEMDKHMPSQRYSYGLISPYSNQCHALSQVIPRHMNLTPKTVDSYQGLEKDVIIISNARTRGCGFLAHYQRLNVALTRPKRCLIICGNFDDLRSVDMWRQLLDDARQRKVYFDLKRDEVNDLQRSLMQKLLVKPL
ncbi:hypothetical protein KR054_002967 [Drosophila jambulina]|nr:hypothetical protein KR054_002967 [Drosophila jambulina]